MKNCLYSTIAAGAWYKYLPRTQGIYSICLLWHVCNSLGLLLIILAGDPTAIEVFWMFLVTTEPAPTVISSPITTPSRITLFFSAVFPNCRFFRIVYAVFLRSLPLGGCSEGTHILAKLRPARGVGHSGRFQLPFGAWGQLCLAIFTDTPLTNKTFLFSRKRCTVS